MSDDIDDRHQRQFAIQKRDAPPHPVLERFPAWTGWVDAGWDVNFLGVKTGVAFFSLYEQLADFSNGRQVSAKLPVPNEDYFEWITLLEAVVDAQGSFTMVELGAGWGKWIGNGVAALRRAQSGLPYRVFGVESEPTHFSWMKQHVQDNAVDLRRATLVDAAVAPHDGHVWFHVGAAADWYGQAIAAEPEHAESTLRERIARSMRRWSRPASERGLERVRAVSLGTLLRPLDRIDLIDADIQGAEADAIEPAADLLDARVKRVYVATHSRDKEDRVRAVFRSLGWESVGDYPSGAESHTPWGRIRFEDGVQVWLNRKVSADGKR